MIYIYIIYIYIYAAYIYIYIMKMRRLTPPPGSANANQAGKHNENTVRLGHKSFVVPPQSGLQYRVSFLRSCGTAARKQNTLLPDSLPRSPQYITDA